MTASVHAGDEVVASARTRRLGRLRHLDLVGLLITVVTLFGARAVGVSALLGARDDVQAGIRSCKPVVHLWPEHFTFENYVHVLMETKIGLWYLNSLITSAAVTVIVVDDGRRRRLRDLAAQFPRTALLLVDDPGELHGSDPGSDRQSFHPDEPVPPDQHAGRAWSLPQLIAPVTVIIYKQFFDSVPKDFREAAVIDGANEFQLLFRIYLPMNWGITTALAIITFIGAWNLFLWPFLAVSSEDKMNITVGITQVHDAFGVQYARDLAVAMLAALPVALVYLIFQRRVTQAIMLSAGIKG